MPGYYTLKNSSNQKAIAIKNIKNRQPGSEIESIQGFTCVYISLKALEFRKQILIY